MIQNKIEKVGNILNNIHVDYKQLNRGDIVDQLIVQIGGGYIKDRNPKLNNFEVLIAQIYDPKNHNPGIIKNHNRISEEITNKNN